MLKPAAVELRAFLMRYTAGAGANTVRGQTLFIALSTRKEVNIMLVQWRKDVDTALSEAAGGSKLVLLDFSAAPQ